MSDTGDLNPYAPPKTDAASATDFRARPAHQVPFELRKAIAALNAHLEDPSAVAMDRIATGRRIRAITLVFGALVPVSAAFSLLVGTDVAVAGWVFAGVFLLLAVILLVADLSVVARDQAADPQLALKAYLKTLGMGRDGYAWACLCPTAREQSIDAPPLGPVVTGAGTFSMQTRAGLKAYAQSFARAGGGQMRTFSPKQVTLAHVDQDVATVDVLAHFVSWPSWVSAATAIGFILFRPAGLIGLVLMYTLRKRHEARFTKTMIRGKNSLWYVYDANLFERE